MLDNLSYEVYTSNLNEEGSVMLYLRVMNTTYPKSQRGHHKKDIPTGIRVPKSAWSGSSHSRFGPWILGDDESTHTRNQMLKDTMDKMDGIYLKIKKQTGREPYAVEIVETFKNGAVDKPRKLLLEFIPEYITAKGITENTARVYSKNLVEALTRFLNVKYQRSNIYLDEIDTVFIYRFEMFLAHSNNKNGKPFKRSTATEYMNKLKAIMTFAKKIGEIDKNVVEDYTPLDANKPDKAKQIVESFKDAITWKISPEALNKIETVPVIGKAVKGDNEENMGSNQNMYDLVRPRLLFLLQSWTGLSFVDMEKMKNVKAYIQFDLVGRRSLIYYRAKTGILACVPLFPEAEALLEQLEWNASPLCSYDTYNRKIKALFRYYNIEMLEEDKEGSTHIPRHLFGSRMLSMGFSIESISRMMGHATISETEKVYARIDLTKIQADYDRIKTAQKTEQIAM